MADEKKGIGGQIFFAAQLLINVHDLNNELTAGNVNEIRQIDLVTEGGEVKTLPAVSGRMMKHWHYEYFRTEAMAKGLKLSESVKIGEPVWPADKDKSGDYVQWTDPAKAIKECAASDVHGFLLATKKGEGEETGGRRTSCVQLSWLLPVLYEGGADSYGLKQVIHSRVAKDPEAQVRSGKESWNIQMPYNKYYASDLYGFVAFLDAGRVGCNEKGELLIDGDEQKKRIRIAINAFLPLLSGRFGASQSHALPHVNPVCVLAGVVKDGSLPLPVSPIYESWVEKTLKNMPDGVKLIGTGEPLKGIEDIDYEDGLAELIEEILEELGLEE